MLKIKKIFINLFFIISLLWFTELFAMNVSDINSYIKDSAITTHIRTYIFSNHSLSNFKIDVNTVNGVVALNGTLDSDAQASTLVEMTQATDGVKNVDTSRLTVLHGQYSLSDKLITAKLNGLFVREKIMNHDHESTIYAETKNGKVYLTGTADSDQQMKKALALAQTIDGVKSIDIHVEINEGVNS